MSPRPSQAFLPLLPLPRSFSPRRYLRRTPCSGLSTPDGLPNLRDLASAAPHQVRAKRIYRGSTPAALPSPPSPESVEFLHATPVLLDLRSDDERASDNHHEMLSACGEDFTMREVHIGLLNKRRVVYGLAKALPGEQARELAWRAVSRPRQARKAIVGRMDEGGLLLLNRILVQAGSQAIGRAMHVVTDAVQGDMDGPRCYFYCSAGKDRTGLLAALILEVLGVSRTEIVMDYARSSETWENGPYALRENYCARLEHAGLTPLKWLGAPPEVMYETLKYIDNKYGSVEDYLITCGFGEDHMHMLRDAMTAR